MWFPFLHIDRNSSLCWNMVKQCSSALLFMINMFPLCTEFPIIGCKYKTSLDSLKIWIWNRVVHSWFNSWSMVNLNYMTLRTDTDCHIISVHHWSWVKPWMDHRVLECSNPKVLSNYNYENEYWDRRNFLNIENVWSKTHSSKKYY